MYAYHSPHSLRVFCSTQSELDQVAHFGPVKGLLEIGIFVS